MSNKLSILVDVEFPSASEMQSKFNAVWQSVKNNLDAKINISADKNSLRSLNKSIKTILDNEKFEVKIDITESLQSLSKINKEFAEFRNMLGKDLKIDLNNDKSLDMSAQNIKFTDTLRILKEIGKAQAEIAQIETRASEGGNLNSKDRNRLEELKAESAELSNQYAKRMEIHQASGEITNSMQQQIDIQNKLNAEEKERATSIAKAKAEQDGINAQLKEYAKLAQQINQLERDKMFSGERESVVIEEQVQALKNKQQTIKDTLRMQNNLTDSMKKEMQVIEETQNEKSKLASQRQQAKNRDRETTYSMGAIDPRAYFNFIERGARAMLTPIQELDTAIIDVKKVAEGTDTQFKEFESSSYSVASSLGVSAKDYAVATEQWASAGKSLVESQELAQATLVGSFVGNIDPEAMVKYAQIPLNAYKTSGLEMTDILNTLNEVANNYAIEMEDLGASLQVSSNSARIAGVSYQELIGLTTGASEATRESGNKIGTALRTTSINFNKIKGQFTKADQNKFDFLKSIGVDLDKTESLTGALEQLASVKDKISKEDFNQALFNLAGKPHQNTISGIIEQWDTVKSAIADANAEMGKGETGSAYIEHAKQADSVNFKIEKLKNTWNEMLSTLAGGSDGVKGTLDTIINGLETINQLASNDAVRSFGKMLLGFGASHALGTGLNKTLDIFKTSSKGFFGGAGSLSSLIGEGFGEMFSKIDPWDKFVKKSEKIKDIPKNFTPLSNIFKSIPQTASKTGKSMEAVGDSMSTASKATSESAGGFMSGLGKVSKGLVGFLPLIGDAIVLLDAFGVVDIGGMVNGLFDKLGGVANLTKSVQSDLKKIDDEILIDPFLSGETAKRQKEVEGLRKEYEKLSGEKGYLNPDEFVQVQDHINTLAKNSGIDIELRLNNKEEILAVLAEIEKANAMQGYGDVAKSIDTVRESRKDIDDIKKRIKDGEKTVIEEKEKSNGRIREHQKKINEIEDMEIGDKVSGNYGDGTAVYLKDESHRQQLLNQRRKQIDEEIETQGELDAKQKELNDLLKEAEGQEEENLLALANAISDPNAKIEWDKHSDSQLDTMLEASLLKLQNFHKEFQDGSEALKEISVDPEISIGDLDTDLKIDWDAIENNPNLWKPVQDKFSDVEIPVPDGTKVTLDDGTIIETEGNATVNLSNLSIEDILGNEDLQNAVLEAIKKKQGEKEVELEQNVKMVTTVSSHGGNLDEQLKMLSELEKETGIKIGVQLDGDDKIYTATEALDRLGDGDTTATITVEANGEEIPPEIKESLSELNEINPAVGIAVSVTNEEKTKEVKEDVDNLNNTNATPTVTPKIINPNAFNAMNEEVDRLGLINVQPTATVTTEGESFLTSMQTQLIVLGAMRVNPQANATTTGQGAISALGASISSLPTRKTITISAVLAGAGAAISALVGRNVSASSPNTFSNIASDVAVKSFSTAGNDVSKTIADTLKTTDIAVTNYAKSSSSGDKAETVNSDIWRYWKAEHAVGDTENALALLTKQLKQSTTTYERAMKIFAEQETRYNNLLKQNQTLLSAQKTELKEVLADLKKKGFNNDGTNVTNLDKAKSFKGDSAKEVEELLNKWKNLRKSIVDTQNAINQVALDLEEVQIDKEFKTLEKTFKQIDKIIKDIKSKNDIFDTRLDLADARDYELQLYTLGEGIKDAGGNLEGLIAKFKTLSTTTTQFGENGEKVYDQMEGLRSEILEQADFIIDYAKELNAIKLERIVDDVERFTDALDRNNDRISTNTEMLKEGLLSGQKLTDLYSSDMTALDLSRQNEHLGIYQERINLEDKLYQVMEEYRVKNVDREKTYNQSILNLNEVRYKELAKMYESYVNNEKISIGNFDGIFYSKDTSKVINAEQTDILASNLTEIFKDWTEKYNSLKNEFVKDIDNAQSQADIDEFTKQYLLNSYKLQEDYYNSSIQGYKDAISALENEMNGTSTIMTAEEVEEIKKQIEEYTDSIIDMQESVREVIKDRFEYEFEMLTKLSDKYKIYEDQLTYLEDVMDQFGDAINKSAYESLYKEMLNNEKIYGNQIRSTIRELQSKQALYEKGSLEWNTINEELDEYIDKLKESNVQLLEINKNILSASFGKGSLDIEKAIFGGYLTHYERVNKMWMSSFEKDLSLENTYKRLSELKLTMYDEQMEYLKAQEKASRYEIEYLNKQLDIIELEQKLSNMLSEKNVQTLKQMEDGTWDFEYTHNGEDIAEVEKELSEKKLELQKAEEDMQKEYLSTLKDILEDAEEGMYGSIEEFENAIKDLNSAYKSLVDEFPIIEGNHIEEILKAYKDYVDQKIDISETIKDTSSLINDETLYDLSTAIVKGFSEISGEIGQKMAEALVSYLPENKWLNDVESLEEQEGVKTYYLDKLIFPNVSSSDEIMKALESLPQKAEQLVNGKDR